VGQGWDRVGAGLVPATDKLDILFTILNTSTCRYRGVVSVN
jgi:hypothetical protein